MGNQLKIVEEQVNQTYDHNLALKMDINATKKPVYSSNWERAVAYHHGLYIPETYQAAKTADEIHVAVADFSEKVHKDSPKDACKYLQIEEFRCLNTHQFEKQPQVAAKKCMKWYDELQKCQWDQAKFNSGITYIEGPQMLRRRPYICSRCASGTRQSSILASLTLRALRCFAGGHTSSTRTSSMHEQVRECTLGNLMFTRAFAAAAAAGVAVAALLLLCT